MLLRYFAFACTGYVFLLVAPNCLRTYLNYCTTSLHLQGCLYTLCTWVTLVTCNIFGLRPFLRFNRFTFQMPPKRPAHVICRCTAQTGKIRRRVTAAAGAPPAEAAPIVVPSVGTTDVMADAIAAAVLRQLEQSGRLLPPPVPQGPPSVSTPAVAQAAPEVSTDDDDDAALSGLLGGELYTPLPSYHVINRPLGASLPDSLKTKIRRGDYVNLQLLLVDNDDDEDDNMYEQQQQRLTLRVGRQDTLSLLKTSTNKAIKPLTSG